jgi:hypothetical protein
VHTQASNEKVTFVDHTWMADGHLVVALSNKRLLIMEGVEVRAAAAVCVPVRVCGCVCVNMCAYAAVCSCACM